MSDDCISRKAAIDAVDSETVSTNPEHFKSSEKFIEFMDDADIASFGKWQWANGFNTALTAVGIDLKRLPSAQPEPCEDAVSRKAVKDGFAEMCNLICPYTEKQRHIMCGSCLLGTAFDVLEATQPVTPKQRTGHWHITDAYPHNVYCSECHKRFAQTHWAVWEDGSLPRNFCPNCGAKMMEGDAE